MSSEIVLLFIVTFFCSIFLITKSWIYLGIFILVFGFTLLISKIKKTLICSLFFLILFICLNVKYFQTETINSNWFHRGTIVEKTTNGFIVKENKTNYFVVSNNLNQSLLDINDKVSFQCYFNKAHGDFLYYLKSKNSSSSCFTKNIHLEEKGNRHYNKVLNKLRNNKTEYAKYTRLILFKDIDASNENIYNSLINLGIGHLIVISGFHISLFLGLLNSIYNKMNYNSKLISFSLSIFCLSGISLVFNFGITAFRAILTTIILFINKELLSEKLTRVEAVSMVGMIFILLNPYYFFNISFTLSFWISYVINVYLHYINYLNWLFIPIIASSLSMFILSPMGITFNLLSAFYSITFTIFLFPILVGSLLFVYIPIWIMFEWYLLVVTLALNFCSSLNTTIVIAPMSSFIILIAGVTIIALICLFGLIKQYNNK